MRVPSSNTWIPSSLEIVVEAWAVLSSTLRRCSRIVHSSLVASIYFFSMVDLPFALTQHVDQIVASFTNFVYKIWEVDTKFVRNSLIGHYPQPPNDFPSLLACAMVSPISNVSSTFTKISRIRLRLNHRQERPTKLREMRNRKPDIRIASRFIKRREGSSRPSSSSCSFNKTPSTPSWRKIAKSSSH